MIISRYEGLFLLFFVVLLLVIKREIWFSVFLSVSGVSLMLLYGLLAHFHGWYFLPNSVLLKGQSPDFSDASALMNTVGYRLLEMIGTNPHIMVIYIVVLLCFLLGYKKNKHLWCPSLIGLILFFATSSIHLQFAKVGWFYRYEAYLVCLGLLIIIISLKEYVGQDFFAKSNQYVWPNKVACSLLVLVFILPLAYRCKKSLENIPGASKNIYEQQYQMGRFLSRYYQDKGVAANDIGAINYLADIHCLDLVGLGNLEVAKSKRNNSYTDQTVKRLMEKYQVECIIIYERWFKNNRMNHIGQEWIKVGEWTISDNVVCAGDTICFYTANPGHKDILIQNLQEFSPFLPKEVKGNGLYTKEKVK